LVKYGVASWYGGGEKLNAHTASGEVFNPDGKTCATWEWPIGTYLRVTNLENGCSVTVKVNDRGPAKCLERLLDLSRQAFSEIAELRKGLIRVEVETLDSGHGGS
jgi:rare lipoprotein A